MNAVSLLPATIAWLQQNDLVESAVLFGSSARGEAAQGTDPWSDLDLHVVSLDAAALEVVDWEKALPHEACCLQVIRPATGGVRKVTAIFATGQIDLVLVPAAMLTQVAAGLQAGHHRQPGPLHVALNEMATCLHSGYRFLKGEPRWSRFYAEVAQLPGVRLTDDEVKNLADIFLCDLLWVRQKIARGELIAAQHALHGKLVDTNLRLWRERRRRHDLPLPSFGLGRRLEALATPAELAVFRISAHAERRELQQAAEQAYATLKAMMAELVPAWSVPLAMRALLAAP